MNLTPQPSNPQLRNALHRAVIAFKRRHESDPRAFVEAVAEVQQLRNARTTWFGRPETELRTDLDRFLMVAQGGAL